MRICSPTPLHHNDLCFQADKNARDFHVSGFRVAMCNSATAAAINRSTQKSRSSPLRLPCGAWLSGGPGRPRNTPAVVAAKWPLFTYVLNTGDSHTQFLVFYTETGRVRRWRVVSWKFSPRGDVFPTAMMLSNKESIVQVRCATVRFLEDSGDGAQLAGSQFADIASIAGNVVCTILDERRTLWPIC